MLRGGPVLRLVAPSPGHPATARRYHRLATPLVARMLESVTPVAAGTATPHIHTGPRDEGLRLARTCYDHIAGRLGVGLADAMVAERWVELDEGTLHRWRGLAARPRPSHSITSSALASSDGGTSRPMALAVLRLSANVNRVGSSKGRSAGLLPARMRLTRAAVLSKISARSGP